VGGTEGGTQASVVSATCAIDERRFLCTAWLTAAWSVGDEIVADHVWLIAHYVSVGRIQAARTLLDRVQL
jgi:hypothetical protein